MVCVCVCVETERERRERFILEVGSCDCRGWQVQNLHAGVPGREDAVVRAHRKCAVRISSFLFGESQAFSIKAFN